MTLASVHWVVWSLDVLGLGFFAIAIAKLGARGSFWQKHHAYWGVLLTFAPARWGKWAVGCWVVGLALLGYDAYQHTRQESDPTYLDWPHRMWARLARWLIGQSWCPAWLAKWLAR